jgi:hypothetical protein
MAFVLFSAMKNEAPFLLEWVAYHRAIGFDHIVIVSNDCSDGTDEILRALDLLGIIRHFRQKLKPGVSAQASATLLSQSKVPLAEGDWAVWLDGDEFLNIHAGAGLVSDLVRSIGAHQGIFIPWRLFGDSGHATFPGRFISEDFTRAAAPENVLTHEGKMFFRASPAIEGFSKRVHRPALTLEPRLRIKDFMAANGRELNGNVASHKRWINGESFEMCHVDPEDFGWTIAQINHYCVRTKDQFALKRLRGRGFRSGQEGEKNARHTSDFFAKMNTNEQKDLTILRHADATTELMADLMKDKRVRGAVNNAKTINKLMLGMQRFLGETETPTEERP